MGFALRKFKNTTPLKRPSKALEYAREQRRQSKPHLHLKDNNFLSRLRDVTVREVTQVQKIVEQHPIPSRTTKEKLTIPVGMLDTDQITTILANKQRYPETWNKSYIASEFKVKEEHAEGLITYFNNYVAPSAKRLKEAKRNTGDKPVTIDN
eukprot:TRINITY_DN1846_c0_g1_i1.p1 TRINITY_DN1846_c0_g1~~TRINITY_DN1846_c0_g1_i1.p1  ORF type:complete len:152 (-),score=10.45 TRINITY_DN1846_c0_g1_i1:136-591(-)